MADKTIFCRRSTDKDKNVLLGRARVCVVVCRIVGVGVIYDLNLAIDIHNQPKIGDDKWHEQHHIHNVYYTYTRKQSMCKKYGRLLTSV